MTTRKVSPRKATVLTSIVLASTMIGGPALAASHIVTRSGVVRAAAATTVVSRLTLGSGPTAGGNKIMIFGTGLATGTSSFTAKAVKFGTTTVSAGSVEALSTSALEVTVPAKASGKYAVLVGDATKGPSYTYVAPDLTVTTDQDDLDDLAPSSDTGQTGATLAGTGFDAASTKVLVGGVSAKATTTATSITYALPAGLAGVQDVVVSDARNSVYVGHVAYAAKVPTLSAVSSYAVNEAATPVTLTGTNLDAVTAVTFVKDATVEKATFAKTTDATKLVVTVPKGAAKDGDLKVVTKYGKSATFALVRKASPTPTVSAVTGAVSTGGTATLTGTNLVGLKSVKVTGGGKTFAGTVSCGHQRHLGRRQAAGDPGRHLRPGRDHQRRHPVDLAVSSRSPRRRRPRRPRAVNTAKTVLTVTGTSLKPVTKVVITPTSGTAITKTTGFTSATDGTTVAVALGSALADGTYGVVVTNALGSTSSVSLTVTTAAPAPSVSDVTFTADDGTAGAFLTLTGTSLEVGTHVRYYLATDDPATDSTTVDVDVKGGSTTNAPLAADLTTGSYKVDVSSDGTTWSTAFDLEVA